MPAFSILPGGNNTESQEVTDSSSTLATGLFPELAELLPDIAECEGRVAIRSQSPLPVSEVVFDMADLVSEKIEGLGLISDLPAGLSALDELCNIRVVSFASPTVRTHSGDSGVSGLNGTATDFWKRPTMLPRHCDNTRYTFHRCEVFAPCFWHMGQSTFRESRNLFP